MLETSELVDSDDSIVDLNAFPDDFKFLKDLDLDQDVQNRLSVHLQGILKGNSEVFTTPICKRLSPEAIRSEWDKIFTANKSKMNPQLLALEESNRDKFGPRSIAKPWLDRKPSLLEYFKSPYSSSALSSKYSEPNLNLRPLSKEKAMDRLKNNTNSGLPFFTRKSKVKKKVLREFDYLKYRKDPCILFTRTQEGDKTRNVWGYPMIDTLIEGMFYFVLLDVQKFKSWRKAILTPEEVDKALTELIDRAISNSLEIISIDFSSYDSSISVNLINEAFRYIKSMFQSTYHDTLDLICKRFHSVSILTPDGVISGDHGVPSGSTFTNEVDSIVQYLVAKSSHLVEDINMQIQGDDGVYAISTRDVDEFIENFEDKGLNVNRDKTYRAKDYCVYLQNLYHPDYRQKSGVIGGVYPVYRALNRIIYQERWAKFEDFGIEGKDYYSLRTISILENCKHHPLFEDLVKFIWSIDKYSLRYTHEGLNKFKELYYEGSGTGGFIENQYGDKVRGLKSFETVKILNRLA